MFYPNCTWELDLFKFYEAQIRDTIPIQYDTDTVKRAHFQNSRYDTVAIRYLKN
jgi:hypothetical protein